MGITTSNQNVSPSMAMQSPFIRIFLEKEMFYQDEPIKGEVWLEPQQTVILSDIIVRLKLQEGWVYNETNDKVISEMNSVILSEMTLNIAKQLNITTQLISLSAGQFHFPFVLHSPGPIQPSFEHPFPNKRGYIRYTLQAETLSQYLKVNAENIVIIKSRPLVLNSPVMFSSCVNVHNWGFFQKGNTILNASYPSNNYRIGDVIPLTINVDNSRGLLDVIQLKIELLRKTTFTEINQAEKYPFEKVIFKQEYNFNVPSRTRNNFSCAITVRDTDLKANYQEVYNPYPFIKDFNSLMPSVDSFTMKNEYSIKISCYFNSYVTHGYRPRVIMPLSITHQLLDDYRLEKKEQEDFENALKASQVEVQGNPQEVYNDPLIAGGNQDNMFMSAMDMRNNNNQIFQQNSFMPNDVNNNQSSMVDDSKMVNNSYQPNNNVNYPRLENSYSQDFQNNIPVPVPQSNNHLDNDGSAPVVDINQL